MSKKERKRQIAKAKKQHVKASNKVRADTGMKEVRDLFLGLNKLIDEWDDLGFSSNNMNLYQDMLEDFYEKNELKVKYKDKFSWQKKMTPEQAEELFDIAYKMASDPYVDPDTYQKMMDQDFDELGEQTKYDTINVDAFSKISDRFADVSTLQDYVEFIDRMNNFKNNALLSSILDSNQVAELYTLGTFQELDEETVNNIIAMEYSMSGKTGDRLYETILEAIDLYDAETGDFDF